MTKASHCKSCDDDRKEAEWRHVGDGDDNDREQVRAEKRDVMCE